MRFKVDENLHENVAEALRTEGHDAQTVYELLDRQKASARGGTRTPTP